MVPSRELPLKLNCANDSNAPSEDGIDPVIKFSSSVTKIRADIKPSDDGIGPDRKLFCN